MDESRTAAILDAVQAHPGSTSKSIREIMKDEFPDIRKKHINQTLYAAAKVGRVERVETDAAPIWNPISEESE